MAFLKIYFGYMIIFGTSLLTDSQKCQWNERKVQTEGGLIKCELRTKCSTGFEPPKDYASLGPFEDWQCMPCTDGQFQNSSGHKFCENCTTTRETCPPKHYLIKNCTHQHDGFCSLCERGKFSDDDFDCQDCGCCFLQYPDIGFKNGTRKPECVALIDELGDDYVCKGDAAAKPVCGPPPTPPPSPPPPPPTGLPTSEPQGLSADSIAGISIPCIFLGLLFIVSLVVLVIPKCRNKFCAWIAKKANKRYTHLEQQVPPIENDTSHLVPDSGQNGLPQSNGGVHVPQNGTGANGHAQRDNTMDGSGPISGVNTNISNDRPAPLHRPQSVQDISLPNVPQDALVDEHDKKGPKDIELPIIPSPGAVDSISIPSLNPPHTNHQPGPASTRGQEIRKAGVHHPHGPMASMQDNQPEGHSPFQSSTPGAVPSDPPIPLQHHPSIPPVLENSNGQNTGSGGARRKIPSVLPSTPRDHTVPYSDKNSPPEPSKANTDIPCAASTTFGASMQPDKPQDVDSSRRPANRPTLAVIPFKYDEPTRVTTRTRTDQPVAQPTGYQRPQQPVAVSHPSPLQGVDNSSMQPRSVQDTSLQSELMGVQPQAAEGAANPTRQPEDPETSGKMAVGDRDIGASDIGNRSHTHPRDVQSTQPTDDDGPAKRFTPGGETHGLEDIGQRQDLSIPGDPALLNNPIGPDSRQRSPPDGESSLEMTMSEPSSRAYSQTSPKQRDESVDTQRKEVWTPNSQENTDLTEASDLNLTISGGSVGGRSNSQHIDRGGGEHLIDDLEFTSNDNERDDEGRNDEQKKDGKKKSDKHQDSY